MKMEVTKREKTLIRSPNLRDRLRGMKMFTHRQYKSRGRYVDLLGLLFEKGQHIELDVWCELIKMMIARGRNVTKRIRLFYSSMDVYPDDDRPTNILIAGGFDVARVQVGVFVDDKTFDIIMATGYYACHPRRVQVANLDLSWGYRVEKRIRMFLIDSVPPGKIRCDDLDIGDHTRSLLLQGVLLDLRDIAHFYLRRYEILDSIALIKNEIRAYRDVIRLEKLR